MCDLQPAGEVQAPHQGNREDYLLALQPRLQEGEVKEGVGKRKGLPGDARVRE